jgi:hypothetical protein
MVSNSTRKKDLLAGPLRKIERANHHIHDLRERVNEYLREALFQIKIRNTSSPEKRWVYTEEKNPIPPDVALITGDVVHNLRSALDHICWGMVVPIVTKKGSVGFPFVETQDKLEDAIKARQMNLAPKRVIEELRSLEPYPDGNKFLHAVHSMNNVDKHRNILVVGTNLGFTVEQFQALTGLSNVSGAPDLLVSTTGDFVVTLDPSANLTPPEEIAAIQPSFTIGFADSEALAGLPVVYSLELMSQVTENAVRRLARAFFS